MCRLRLDNVFVLLSFQLPKLVVESSVPWEEGLILMKWDLFVVVVLPWTFLHRLVVTSSLLQLSFYVGSASVVHKFFFYVFFRMKVVHFLQERATLVLMTMKTNFSMMTIWKMAAGKDRTTALRLTVLMTVIMTSKLTKESLYIVWRQIKTLRETQSSYHFAITCCSRNSRRCHWNVTDHF